jgi:hypothetical protein
MHEHIYSTLDLTRNAQEGSNNRRRSSAASASSLPLAMPPARADHRSSSSAAAISKKVKQKLIPKDEEQLTTLGIVRSNEERADISWMSEETIAIVPRESATIDVPALYRHPFTDTAPAAMEANLKSVGSFVNGKETIYIAIASYRDWQCYDTVDSLLSRADHPERLIIGVVQQNLEGDAHCKTPPVPCSVDDSQMIW